MKVLVTGGGGYLGSVLVGELLLRGHTVIVLDDFRHGIPSLAGYCDDRHLTILRGDVTRIQVARRCLEEEPHAVIHLAAIVGQQACEENEDGAYATNVDAVEQLVRLLSGTKTALIYPCTNSGYGRMTGEAICTEDSPLNPISIYGKTKVEGERIALTHPFSVSLRFATLFGASPRMRKDLMVNDFVYRAVSKTVLTLFEGQYRRNFLHVRDAAHAIVWMLSGVVGGKSKFPFNVYNVGDSRANMSKFALCSVINRHIALMSEHDPIGADPDQRDYLVSNRRIEATGWHPHYSIDDGIVELIRLYQMPMPV